MKLIMLLPSFSRFRSTPQKAAKVIAQILTDTSEKTGIYFDEKGNPMQGSEISRDEQFQKRVVTETRALLAKG